MSKKVLLNLSLQTILIALTIGFVGCTNSNNVINNSSTSATSTEINNNLPNVVATTSVLCDLTQQIAQETINLTCLIPPNVHPVSYQPTSEDRKVIEEAKLILYNGYNFEPRLIKLIKASNSRGLKIAVAQRAVTKPLKFTKDDETVPDPYVWHNTKNAVTIVEVISNNLGKVVSKNTTLYRNNAKKIKSELIQLDSWIKLRIASIPKNQRRLITNRDAMGYYAKAYGLAYAGVIQGVNDNQITSSREKSFVRYIKRNRIQTLFTDTTNKSNLMTNLAQEANVKISERTLFADSLGTPGTEGDTYQKMMVANTRTIVEGLGGTYLIFEPQALD